MSCLELDGARRPISTSTWAGLAAALCLAGASSPVARADDVIRCGAGQCERWVAPYGGIGAGFADWAYSLVVGPDGSRVFVTGNTASTLVGGSWIWDVGTVSYDAATGNELWAARYAGPAGGSDDARSLALSPDGARLYVTGWTSPNQYPGSASDSLLTIAYDAATGAELWVSTRPNRLGGTYPGSAIAVAADGARVFVLAPASDDVVAVAYDAASGSELWATRFPSSTLWIPMIDFGRPKSATLTVDPGGERLYVTLTRLVSQDVGDFLTVALGQGTGSMLWEATYDGGFGDDRAQALVLSPDGGALYVTGRSQGMATGLDFATAAYRADTGEQLWVGRFSGTGNAADLPLGIAVSPTAQVVYVAGQIRTSLGGPDMGAVAFDASSGEVIWSVTFDPPQGGDLGGGGDWDLASAVTASPDGSRVYIVGWANYADPGSIHDHDWVVIALTAADGAQLWAVRKGVVVESGSVTHETAMDVALSPGGGTLYVTGRQPDVIQAYGSFDYATVAYDITQPPLAELTADPTSGEPPLTVTFGLGASDGDGLVDTWSLDFEGDGLADTSGLGLPPLSVTHTYPEPGQFTARLTVSDDHGAIGTDEVQITVTDPTVGVPERGVETHGALLASFPNPFRGTTTIEFTLARPDRVRLAVHDLGGRRVRTIAEGGRGAGTHTATWDGRDERGRAVPAGVYTIRLEAGARLRWRRTVVLR